MPFVGLGMSFPVGYWLGIVLLCKISTEVPYFAARKE